MAGRDGRARGRAALIIYLLCGAALLIEAATSFGAELLTGEVAGWPLFVHLLAAPLFVSGLTGVAIVGAEGAASGLGRAGGGARLALAARALFWVALLLGLLTMGAMLAAMLPLFGYAAQQALREAHEVGALLLLLAAALYGLARLAARRAER